MNPDQPVHGDILRMQEQFWKALQAKDAASLTALISPRFVGRSPGEPDQTRDVFIATLVGFPVTISEIGGEAIEIHVFGEVAVLTGVQVARLQLSDGSARSSRVMLTNVFCHEDRGWQMALSHAFELVQDV
ncbi:MAG TPA: nuclear transport factor 2 family protein [Ktedonobacterales bacterium]